jgi:hypothetical protein
LRRRKSRRAGAGNVGNTTLNLQEVPVERDDMVNPYFNTLKKRNLYTTFGVWKISGDRLMSGNTNIHPPSSDLCVGEERYKYKNYD